MQTSVGFGHFEFEILNCLLVNLRKKTPRNSSRILFSQISRRAIADKSFNLDLSIFDLWVLTMARQKRSSRVIEKAQQRAAGLKMISENLEVGNSLTLESFSATIEQIRSKLEAYNSLLAKVNVIQADLVEGETQLKHMTEDMLIGVASKYGKDSYEYKLAGGTRRSERKRPVRKPKTTTTS